jgi:NADH dehydrogenase/NADH:ubiquinone oxidoreductase subunit G
MSNRITTEYANQYKRPDDAVRDREETARKEALQERAEEGTRELEGLTEFHAAMQTAVDNIGAEPTQLAPTVDAAIAAGTERARAAVEAAKLTRDQRLARAIAAELKQQPEELADAVTAAIEKRAAELNPEEEPVYELADEDAEAEDDELEWDQIGEWAEGVSERQRQREEDEEE